MEPGQAPPTGRAKSVMSFTRQPLTPQRKTTLAVLAAGILLLLSFLITSSVWPAAHALFAPGAATRAKSIPGMSSPLVPSQALQWAGDTQTTRPNAAVAPTAMSNLTVDGAFSAYYRSHGGATRLGAPITQAFFTSDGWVQFFANTALILPPASGKSTGNDTPLAQLIRDGVHDSTTGVVELPLLHSLLAAGSLASVPGTGGNLTYADLRAATTPRQDLIEGPIKDQSDSIFVPEASGNGKYAGHRIPTAVWQFINDPAIAPDGWRTDFGVPLTEALPAVVTASDGTQHHELVQAFWQTALVLDQDDQGANGTPVIQRLALGADYLATLGYPAASAPPGTPAWVTANVAVMSAPTSGGTTVAHVGQYWPITLSGDARWIGGVLWYAIGWQAGHHAGNGWLPANALTQSAPPKGSDGLATAWLDALSPDLTSYVAHLNGDAGVAIYDVTRNQYYSEYGDNTYVMGSSAKIPILLTYLNSLEQQGRGPRDDENWRMTTMIENSNNDSAQYLFDTVGGDPAIISYLRSIGIGGWAPNPNGWGWATFSPNDMAHLLYKLYSGQILNSHDRAYVLSLLNHIEDDQRYGVGNTAPSGASYAMKDGWLTAPDGLWAANSSGILTIGGETYIISVYTAEQTDLDTNYDILNHVCGAVVPLLK